MLRLCRPHAGDRLTDTGFRQRSARCNASYTTIWSSDNERHAARSRRSRSSRPGAISRSRTTRASSRPARRSMTQARYAARPASGRAASRNATPPPTSTLRRQQPAARSRSRPAPRTSTATKWRPMWPDVEYYRGNNTSVDYSGNVSLPSTPASPLRLWRLRLYGHQLRPDLHVVGLARSICRAVTCRAASPCSASPR